MTIRSSPLVRMAAEAQRPTRWWLAWIVTILIILVGANIGGIVGMVVLGNPEQSDPIYQYQEFFVFGASLVLLFLWVRFKERRGFSSVGLRGRRRIGKLLLGIVLGTVMMTVGVLVPWGLGQYGTGMSQHTKAGSGALLALLPLLLLFVFQASTEEATTRGYMLQVGGLQLPASVAIIGSSVIFAVIHLDFRPITLLNITLYAIFASFVALGEGDLWLICGIHAGWNYAQGNIFGLPVSGNTEATSLFSFGPSKASNDILTGADFGVEASLVGTGVLLVALTLAVLHYRRRQAARTAASRGVPGPRHAGSVPVDKGADTAR